VNTNSRAEATSPLLKKFFQRLKGQSPENDAPAGDRESGFFSTLFQDRGEDGLVHSTWATRAIEVHAEAFDRARGNELFSKLWGEDRHFAALSADDLTRLSTYLEFVQVAPNQEVIGQNEQGDYLMIVLDGTLAVDRVQPWGGRARLAEAHAGDMLGEMSLLDARRLDEMIDEEPRLAVALLASLSRRLSLRLRQVSARLSALLSRS